MQSTRTVTIAGGFSDVSESASGGLIYNNHIRAVSVIADYRLQDSIGGTGYLTLKGCRVSMFSVRRVSTISFRGAPHNQSRSAWVLLSLSNAFRLCPENAQMHGL